MPNSASELPVLAEAALASGAPLDVSSSPGLWGGYLRGTDRTLTAISTSDFERSTEDRHAADLVQAHLFEILTCLGRDCLDVYFLRIRRAVEEFQIAGALEALEVARQEGHVRFIGIFCDGPPLATLGTWQFHDAFELLLAPSGEALETLAPLARERRVGVVSLGPWVSDPGAAEFDSSQVDHPVMIPVRSAEEVWRATGIASASAGGAR